jgi:hypothetical protein
MEEQMPHGIGSAPQLTLGTALYVLDRLLADKRITAREVAQYVSDLPNEIARVEARLDALRGAKTSHLTPTRRRRPAPVARTRNSGNGKALGGMYGGLIRRVPKSEQARYKQIKARDGIRAAIMALRGREST